MVVATVVFTALFLLAVRRWPRIAAATAVLLVAILFLDLIRVNYGNNLTRGQRDVIAEFSAIADFVADYPEPYRVFSEPILSSAQLRSNLPDSYAIRRFTDSTGATPQRSPDPRNRLEISTVDEREISFVTRNGA